MDSRGSRPDLFATEATLCAVVASISPMVIPIAVSRAEYSTSCNLPAPLAFRRYPLCCAQHIPALQRAEDDVLAPVFDTANTTVSRWPLARHWLFRLETAAPNVKGPSGVQNRIAV